MASTDVAIAADRPISKQQGRSKPGRIGNKLRTGLDALVHEGLQLDQAATKAGLTTHAMRLALTRPHVLAYLRQQREVLRASISGAGLLVMDHVMRKSRNDNARVNAFKAIEQSGESETNRSSSALRAPGMVIQIIQQSSLTPQYQQIEAKPLQTNVSVPTDGVGNDK